MINSLELSILFSLPSNLVIPGKVGVVSSDKKDHKLFKRFNKKIKAKYLF